MKKYLKLIILIVGLGLIFNRAHLAWGSNYEDDINSQIKALNDQISSQKQKISDIQDKQKQYTDLINQKQDEQMTLKNDLSIINDRLDKANLEIESTQLNIDKTNLEMKKLSIDIQSKDEDIDKNKENNHFFIFEPNYTQCFIWTANSFCQPWFWPGYVAH